jgi:lysozyme family protein
VSAQDWTTCWQSVLASEGWDAYTNNPDDPGGPTRFGITMATLQSWRGMPVGPDDVKALGQDEALAIYSDRYWRPICGDDLPPGIDLAVFDAAVNMGPGTAARLLQRCLGVADDGKIGPQTIEAAEDADAVALVSAFSERRLAYYQALSTWDTFGHGWTNRVNRVEDQAKALISPPPSSQASA